jgi:hypothetical protein
MTPADWTVAIIAILFLTLRLGTAWTFRARRFVNKSDFALEFYSVRLASTA